MIIRNIMVILVAGLLLSPSPGLAAESPPHEALFHVFIESMKAEGILTDRNAEIAIDEARALETCLFETLSETEHPSGTTSQAIREHVRLKLSRFLLSESIKEDDSHKTRLLIQLTAFF